MADPYETLGVARNSSQDDIRKAYRKAAKETHPDLNPGKPEAEARFKVINAAYDVIGDPDKRKKFDAGEIDETALLSRIRRSRSELPLRAPIVAAAFAEWKFRLRRLFRSLR
jgi:curved DNA-binding protein CbpA